MPLSTRLCLFFLAALAVVLLGFSATLYYLAATHLQRQFDDGLEAMMKVLQAAAEIESEGIEWKVTGTVPQMVAGGAPICWAVLDGDGVRIDGVEEALTASTSNGFGVRQRHLVEDASRHTKNRRPRNHYAGLTFVVAASEAPLQHTLRNLALTLAGLSLTVWTAAALTGHWLCRRALKPLTSMAETARTMTAAELERRLPNAGTGDELDELGCAFNDLLSRLQESFERQRRFTGDASHQLRTPLTAMLGQVEVALRRERSPEEYQRVLTLVHRQSAKLREMVEMLLFLARADAESKQPQPELLDLEMWLPEHLQTWSAHARFADLHLDVPSSTSLPVRVQAALLGQLVDNLLDNACKYSEAGTPITLRLSTDANRVLLAVADAGYGIEAAELPCVFEAFYRSPQARKLGRSGIGLGLAVARRIAAAFGGELHATSELGEGSCFTLQLPLATVELKQTTEEPHDSRVLALNALP
jgi:heavy metal sensor kinase